MKKLSFFLCFLLIAGITRAQNPTLSVGLETLTMNKGTIDVEALTAIIMEKQAELKKEALKRFMLGLFPETNYTTKFYIQNCLTVLLNEKNPQVIEKEIYELTTNYALALGVAKVYAFKSNAEPINAAYRNYLKQDVFTASKMLDDYKVERFENNVNESNKDRLADILCKIKKIIGQIEPRESYITSRKKITDKYLRHRADSIRNGQFRELARLEKLRLQTEKKLVREKIRMGLVSEPVVTSPDSVLLPFGMWVDMASAALSEMKLLTDKGFFRKKIDFRLDGFYQKLNNPERQADTSLKKVFDKTIEGIKAGIEPYIKYYSIIDTYYKAITDKDADTSIRNSIVKNLQGTIKGIGEDNIKKLLGHFYENYSSVKVFLDGVETSNAKIRKIDFINNTLKSLPKLKDQYDKLNLTMTDIKTKYAKFKEDFPDLGLDTLNINKIKLLEKDSVMLSLNLIKTDSVISTVNFLINEYSAMKPLIDSVRGRFETNGNTAGLELESLGMSSGSLKKISVKSDFKLLDYENTIKQCEEVKAKEILKIDQLFDQFAPSKDFFKALLAKISNDLTSSLLPSNIQLKEENKEFYDEYTSLLATTYKQINTLIAADNIKVEDVTYFEENVIPEFLRLGAALSMNSDKLNKNIQTFNVLSQMLKVQTVTIIPVDFKYDKSLMEVLKFVSNLGKLDKAETYQDMLNLFEHVNQIIADNIKDEEFRKTYILFSNAVKKYTLVNGEEQSVEIDVASFLTELQQYYGRNNNSVLGLYLTLGLNQNFFFRKVTFPGETEGIKNIGFASEKLGLKIRFNKVRSLRGLENTVLTDVNLNTNAPFVNEWYGVIYGSGLLYSVANSSTNANFDYPHMGIGTGIRFYNALDVNFIIGFPFIKNQSMIRNAFAGIGLDIPLGEYLEKIGNKK